MKNADGAQQAKNDLSAAKRSETQVNCIHRKGSNSAGLEENWEAPETPSLQARGTIVHTRTLVKILSVRYKMQMDREVTAVRRLKPGDQFSCLNARGQGYATVVHLTQRDGYWFITFVSELFPNGMINIVDPDKQVFVKHGRLTKNVKEKCLPKLLRFSSLLASNPIKAEP
jgi:hypothetical protein